MVLSVIQHSVIHSRKKERQTTERTLCSYGQKSWLYVLILSSIKCFMRTCDYNVPKVGLALTVEVFVRICQHTSSKIMLDPQTLPVLSHKIYWREWQPFNWFLCVVRKWLRLVLELLMQHQHAYVISNIHSSRKMKFPTVFCLCSHLDQIHMCLF